MNRFRIFLMLAAGTAVGSMYAQTAIDAYQISQSSLKGTARYMSMAGAFGALGGDLSTLNHNPGGIGIYRSSEIGVTVDFDFQKTATDPKPYATGTVTNNQTKVYCNNFGYIGAINLNSEVMPYMQWGASYSRLVSFDRVYQGNLPTLGGSLTNYVADYTTADGYTQSELSQYVNNDYNPYQDSWAPWMSILFYNNYLINPNGNNGYQGLWQHGTSGAGNFVVRERGHVDEYSINFGGNIYDKVYWGIGFGITDIDYVSNNYYSETLSNARVPNSDASGTTTGSGGFGLDSWKHIHGSGFNFKAGVILKPINEFRVGLAVHTPTYYNLTQEGYASVDYDLSTGYYPTSNNSFATETDYGYNDWFEWEARTPWRLIVSAATVLNGRIILSGDYEYRPYGQMNVADRNGVNYEYMNSDVQTYYRTSNIWRLGAEYRLTPQVSVRAGYCLESTPVTKDAECDLVAVYTSGPDDTETTPSYAFDKNTQYITAGIGYRYKGFYIDAAYVHKNRKSTYHAFTPRDNYGGLTLAAQSEVTDNNNSLVVSVGFKF